MQAAGLQTLAVIKAVLLYYYYYYTYVASVLPAAQATGGGYNPIM